MTCVRLTELLLFFLLLSQVSTEEPEVTLREEGKHFVIGYCFGADFIVVYKSIPGGYQLLGNSSHTNLPDSVPAELKSRIDVNNDKHLMGLQISNLKEPDSATYRRECWKNQKLVSNHTEQLLVCKEEISPEEITVNTEGGAEIRCNSPSIGQEGTSVRWYYEIHPSYKPTLLLDTSVSLELLTEELQDAVEAKENGALLVLDKTVLKSFPQFYCAVIHGETCLDFLNIFSVENTESWEIFVSEGDRVVLNCLPDDNQRHWETPLGQINSSTPTNNQMYISAGDEPKNFPLIIPVVSEEHSGEYVCVSPSTDIQYELHLCPKSKEMRKDAHTGTDVSLECNYKRDKPNRVRWHLHNHQDHYELIAEIVNDSVVISERLKGKITLSESGPLIISDLNVNDTGVYVCIVLTQTGFVENEDFQDYEEESTAEYDTTDYTTDYEHFDETIKCIFKQETHLNVALSGRSRPLNVTHVKTSSGTDSKNTSETPEAPDAPTQQWPAVAGGLVVLAVVVVVIIVVVIKKRRAKGRPDTENGML